MIDLFQIFVAKGHILPRPAPVYIRRCKVPVVVPDTAPVSYTHLGLPLTVDDAEAIQKSWPNFFAAIRPLGVEVEYARCV